MPETLENYRGHVLIVSIQEVMPMVNSIIDLATVLSFFILIFNKIIEAVPPRLLEVSK